MVKVTVTYIKGSDDYDVTQKECSITEALFEISRKAMSNLSNTLSNTQSVGAITFTFFTSDTGAIFSFFYGTIRKKHQ